MLLLIKRKRTLALTGSNPAPATKEFVRQDVDQPVSPVFFIYSDSDVNSNSSA
jgi:hypothetical protein